MLDEFQRTPLMHKIKSITIDRPENAPAAKRRRSEDMVAVRMTVEAIIITAADRRPNNLLGVDQRLLVLNSISILAHGPAAIALSPSLASPTLAGRLGAKMEKAREEDARRNEARKRKVPVDDIKVVRRDYRDIARQNVFAGLAPVERDETPSGPTGEEIEVTRYTFLTDITLSDWRSEASYYIRTSHQKKRLGVLPGFNIFRITDDDDQTVVSGKVLKIDPRDIYFQVGNNYYAIHVGQNFAEAMRRKLPPNELQSLGLATASSKGAKTSTQEEK